MSQQQQRHPWGWALAELEQLLDGRLLDFAQNGPTFFQGVKFEKDLDALGSFGLPPDGVQDRLSRVVRLAAEQLRQLDAALLELSIADIRGTYFSALQAGMILGDSCLQLLWEAQLGGQDLYRLAASICALTFGSGQRILRQSVSAWADAHTAYLHLRRQAAAMRRLVLALGEPWARSSGPAIARTVLKASSVLPWMGAAASALRLAHSRLVICIDPAGAALSNLAQLSVCAANLVRVVAWLADVQLTESPLGMEEACLLDVALCGLNIQLRLAEGLAASAANGSKGAARPGSSSSSGSGPQGGAAAHSLEELCFALCLVSAGACYKLACLKALEEEGGAMQLLAPAGPALRLLLAAGPELPAELRAEGCFYVLRLASVPRVAWAEEPLSGDSVPAGLQEAAGLMMQLVPDIATALRLYSKAESSASSSHVALAVSGAHAALDFLCFAGPLSSADQVLTWCRAADVCLRLLPVLGEVHAEWSGRSAVAEREQPPGGTAQVLQAVMVLVHTCIDLWTARVRAAGGVLAQSLTQAHQHQGRAACAAVFVTEPLWQLHSTTTRLVHWAVGMDRQHASNNQPACWLPDWPRLAGAVADTLHTAVVAAQMDMLKAGVEGAPGEQHALLRRRLQAMCAAHAQVVPVLADKLGIQLSEPGSAQVMHSWWDLGLEFVVLYAPAPLVDPNIVAAYIYVLRQTGEASCGPALLVRHVSGTLTQAFAFDSLPYTALLLTSGLMEHVLEVGVQAGIPDAMLRTHLLRQMLQACLSLEQMSSQVLGVADRTVSSHLQEHIMAPLPQLQGEDALDEVLCAALEGLREVSISELLTMFKQALFPPAAKLARALQDYWAQTEQQAAAQLEAAQVVSARSCAYLRCANLTYAGGPAAGQGEGSKRCSACRSAYYCSAECSRADWGRGGWHRQACKVLAAAQQGRQPAGNTV